MVGDPVLLEVVGANAFRPVAGAHHLAARRCRLRLLPGHVRILESGAQQRQGPCPVLVLRALVLALHDDAAGQVREPHRRVRLVDVLTACAGCTECIHPQIAGIDLHVRHVFRLRHDRDRAGRGVDPALGFRLRDALHAMGPGLELESGVGALARHPADHLLVAAVLAFVAAENLHLPAVVLDIALVHPEQVAGEQRGFVSAGPGPYFQKQVGVVIRVRGHELEHQGLFPNLALLQQGCKLRKAQVACFGVIAVAQFLRGPDVVQQSPVVGVGLDQGLQPGVLLCQAAKRRLIGNDFRPGQRLADLRVAIGQGLNPGFEGGCLFFGSAHDGCPCSPWHGPCRMLA